MIILGPKYFSGYASTPLQGAGYISAQVLDKGVLDPVDKGTELVDKYTESGKLLRPRSKKKLEFIKAMSPWLREKIDKLKKKRYKRKKKQKNYSSVRMPVSKEDLEKAKLSGVIQRRPDNGKWGIIAIQKKLWWSASYDTREKALNALRAYQAHKR